MGYPKSGNVPSLSRSYQERHHFRTGSMNVLLSEMRLVACLSHQMARIGILVVTHDQSQLSGTGPYRLEGTVLI